MSFEKHRKTHGDRTDLAGEHRISDIGQLVCLLAFMTVWILDSFIFRFSNFLARFIPWWILILMAVPLWGFAVYLAYHGMKMVFGGAQKHPGIITSGIFKITRHPIYLASMLVYLGWIISTLSLLSLGLFVLIAVFYNYIANYEEKILLEKFGLQYEEYIRKVPKWGIRFVKRK